MCSLNIRMVPLSFERVKIINGIFRVLPLRVLQLVPLLCIFFILIFLTLCGVTRLYNRSVSSHSFGLFWHTK